MSDEFFEYFDQLDREQFEAAINIDGNLLTLAAPGGGKTRTLIAKALAELEAHPVYIMTFTISAAEEIKARIAKLLETKPELADRLQHVGTLHSWCLGRLRSSGDEREVVDETAEAEIATGIVKRLRLRITNKRLSELVMGDQPSDSQERSFVKAFADDMRENKVLSYDGILQDAALSLALEPPQWPRQPIFLIDEAQDSSLHDLAIYAALMDSGAQLWMVGDLQQAIYAFRHLTPINVWEWWQKLGYGVAELKTNYRSGSAVVRALNVINQGFVPRIEMHAAAGAPGGEVKLLTAETEMALLMQLRNRLVYLRDNLRAAPETVAVLCRTNKECALVAHWLEGESFKVRIKTPELPERIPIKLWAALGFYRQPESDWMAKRYLRSIGADDKSAQKRATRGMRSIGYSIFPALFALDRTTGEWVRWMDILAVPKAEQAWFYQRMPDGWEGHDWDEIVMRLFEAPLSQEAGTGITVTTVHAAKGREWQHVLMPFCDQQSYRPKNGVEEERVFFVGASRAIETLTFFYSRTRVDEYKGGMTEVAKCGPLDRIIETAKKG
jgi:superfamily I DNA/RNA helicase